MIETKYTITLEGLLAGLTDRQINGALNHSKKLAADDTFADFINKDLPKRFDGSKQRELKWQERDPGYKANKLELRHHTDDMKWTGHSKRRARDAKPFATSKRVGADVQGLGRQFHRRKRNQPDLKRELRRFTDREKREYANAFVFNLVQHLVERLKHIRKRIKI